MKLVSEQQVEALISLAHLRAVDARLTEYSREQARETVGALEELLVHLRAIPVQGVVRDGMVEAL